MSRIALVAGQGGRRPPVSAMVQAAARDELAMEASAMAADARAVSAWAGAGLAPFERDRRGATRSGLAQRGALLVAADASLYHVAELRRALGSAGVPDLAPDAPSLVLAAYATWGDDAFSRLEGDFAVVVFDARHGRVVAARDVAGARALYYAASPERIAVASAVRGLLADPEVPRDGDLDVVAAVAAGLWVHGSRTAYAAINELPAGHLLRWERGATVVAPYWTLPERLPMRRTSVAAAADELRPLLEAAVAERLAVDGPTAISLSGGWDSPAVYGTAEHLVRTGRATGTVRAVSLSYPPGDPGREDELIEAILAHWGAATRWLAVDDIALLAGLPASAGTRDLPFAHAYEAWNRALYRGARDSGATVLLDGAGGDQLFQASDIVLADLFRRGRWWELARQWRRRGGRGWRNLWRWAIRPALPASVQAAVARVRNLPTSRDHLHRAPSWWMVESFVASHGLLERDAEARPSLPGGGSVLAESHAFLRFPYFARILSLLTDFALDEGVERRSPLLDRRVIDWAVRRPWSERTDGRETKLVLRAAMEGRLPANVLAPRPHRTGITSAYFLRQLRASGGPLVDAALRDSRLVAVGAIDPHRLRRAWEHVIRHDDDETASRLLLTVQAEFWLRAHESGHA